MKRRLLRRPWRLVWFPWELGGGQCPFPLYPLAKVPSADKDGVIRLEDYKTYTVPGTIEGRLVLGTGTVLDGRTPG